MTRPKLKTFKEVAESISKILKRPLTEEELSKYRPSFERYSAYVLPPEILVDARQDRIHEEKVSNRKVTVRRTK